MSASHLLRRYIRDLIFGAVDGTVTTFAVVAGAVGAGLGSGVILVLGITKLIADAFSMAVSNYLGTRADQHQPEYISHPRDNAPGPRAAASATFLAFILVGAIPLVPFAVHALSPSVVADPLWPSCALTAAAFVGIGVVKSAATDSSAWRGSAETLALGGGAALLAFGVGWLLRGATGV